MAKIVVIHMLSQLQDQNKLNKEQLHRKNWWKEENRLLPRRLRNKITIIIS